MADLWRNEAIAQCHKLASAFMGHIESHVRGKQLEFTVKQKLTTELTAFDLRGTQLHLVKLTSKKLNMHNA